METFKEVHGQDERDAQYDQDRERAIDGQVHHSPEVVQIASIYPIKEDQESLIMEKEELQKEIDHLTWSIGQDENLLRYNQTRIKKIEELLSTPDNF